MHGRALPAGAAARRRPRPTRPSPPHLLAPRRRAADWDACSDTDFFHWSQFDSFKGLHAEVVRHGGRCPCERVLRWAMRAALRRGRRLLANQSTPRCYRLRLRAWSCASACTRPALTHRPSYVPHATALATHPYVYLRWKEQLFLSGGECRLSINGEVLRRGRRGMAWRRRRCRGAACRRPQGLPHLPSSRPSPFPPRFLLPSPVPHHGQH